MKFSTVLIAMFLQCIPISAMACCGGGDGEWYQSIIKNLAVSLGEDADDAKAAFDKMVKRRYSELYLIKESKEPCQLFGGCGTLGNPLIIKIANAAMKYQEYDVNAEKEWWDSTQKLILGFIALAGLGLGLANRYRPRQ